MIVPVDAWNKMLNQLGNLHEAGQQLAEARERAAKAETEALFLRERLAEMREDSDPSRRPRSLPLSPIPSPSSEIPPPQGEVARRSRGRRGSSANRARPVQLQRRSRKDGAVKATDAAAAAETAPFWRYVVRGWRGRRR